MTRDRSWNGDPYITVGDGHRVSLNNPRPEDFEPGLTAYRLAGIYRYTGGSRFTVAQHCVVAAEMAKKFYPNETYLPHRMLIHDADESVYGDVSSPLKSLLPEYARLEELGQLAVEEHYGLTFIGDPLVREVDLRMWLSERQYGAAPGGPATEDYTGDLVPFPLSDWEISTSLWAWSPTYAKQRWLSAHRDLFTWM